MLSDRKRSSHRLSSLFSLGSSSTDLQSTNSASSSESSGKPSKVRNRLSSATHLSPDYPPPPPPHQASLQNPTIQPVESAPVALEPPPSMDRPASSSFSPARTANPNPTPKSRPGTSNGDGLLPPAEGGLKKLRRRSKLFGGGQSSDEQVNQSGQGPLAWVVGHRGKLPYNLTMLLNGEKVPELWDDTGDTFVYLFPRTSTRGPSFRIDSAVYAASHLMTRLVHGTLYSEPPMAPGDLPDRSARSSTGPLSSSRTASPDPSMPEGSSDGSKGSRALSDATEDDHSEKHLYMPISLSTDNMPVMPGAQEPRLSSKDIDTLVTYRNFIAFLIGQSLVATERHSEIFDVFMRIADILQHYQFSNVDGSTYGEVAASSFDNYVDELNLADIRTSREKTIEAVVLGERMRSLNLYIEGFVHASGKFENIRELQHPKFDLISPKTTTRMARAAMDLAQREQAINTKLENFDFPAIFSGLMNSDTSEEKKLLRFKNWKSAFMGARAFTLDYYKTKYGSWLPKARSKKNNLTISGINRLALLDMYQDMSSLYDFLVDRTNLTTRTADGFITEEEGTDLESVARRALRKVLSEYDRSTPPVQPPIPFDLPHYPTLKGLKPDYPSGDLKKDAKAQSKKLKTDEVNKMIKNAHNPDAEQHTAFLDAFRRFELKQAHGKTMQELCELRTGQWIFMYAVIQSLPMLVVDAPGVRFTEGVEYFLCEVPRSGVPWGRDDTNRARTWFGVAGGSQVVSLPTDIVEHGVEGTFRRSHCWKMAEKWSQNDMLMNAAVHEINAAPLPPPPSFLDPASAGRSRSSSPDRRRESVMNLGLEALPLPPGIAPTASSPMARPQSSNDPTKTFDAILQSADISQDKKKKKKK